MKYNISSFKQGLENLNICLNEKQIEQFITYYELLVEKNKVMNLTAITDFEEVITKHFLDSLCIASVYDMTEVKCLADIGTGAGFPGIPLKIAFPDIEVVLVDSLNKRIDFLQEVADKIGLEKISCIHARAEDAARNENLREKFDLVVSRAVAALPVLLEYDTPFVRVGGNFVAYKAEDVEEELAAAENAIKTLGCIVETKKTKLPNTDINRSFCIFKKLENTPSKYPRKAGMPVKKPL